MNISAYWIKELAKTAEFTALAETEDIDINILKSNIEDLMDNQFIETAKEYGIARRETMLNIRPSMGETLEIRRDVVAINWNNALPYTYKQLEDRMNVLAGEGEYQITLRTDTYELILRLNLIIINLEDSILDMVNAMAPSNLIVTIEINYNQYEDLAAYTYGELEAYTYIELRQEVLV